MEVIIGLTNDAQFGPVIMFGLGGIFTELLEDVSFRVLPSSAANWPGQTFLPFASPVTAASLWCARR